MKRNASPRNSSSNMPAQQVLNSWVEIAAYLGRGVRTAQRWEREVGLPVYRPNPRRRSAVFAYQEEVDAWLRRASTCGAIDVPQSAAKADPSTEELLARSRKALSRHEQILIDAAGLLNDFADTVSITRALRQTIRKPWRAMYAEGD